jgi:iron complex outermembrane receptor protein
MPTVRRHPSPPSAWLVLLVLSGAASAAASQSPLGTWHARRVTLELTALGQARFSSPVGGQTVASLLLAGDTATFRDERGAVACPSGTGRYLWHLEGDTLRFRLLSDPCDRRRTALELGWARGEAPAVQAVELSPVVVTAQRQLEDAQRAPVAIDVVGAEKLRDARITQPQSLTYLIPGLQVGSGGGGAILYMRGVGSFVGTFLNDPGISINFDGVVVARPNALDGLFYDLDRVEALKGPQGTLYGRNATGGAINLLPRRPELGHSSGQLSAEYGSHGALTAEGALNAALGRRAALRFAGQRVRHDAWLADGTDDRDDWSGRLTLRFDPTNALGLRVAADFSDQRGHGAGATPIALGIAHRFGITSAEAGAYYSGQRVAIAGRNFLPIPSLQHADNQHGGASGTLDWQTKIGRVSLVSAWRESALDFVRSSSGLLFKGQEQDRQASIEAALVSTPLPRVVTRVGIFFFDEENGPRDGLTTRPHNQFNVSFQEFRSGVTSLAPFGRATWSITDRLRATAGARYTHERKDFSGTFQSFNLVCPPPGAGNCPNLQPFPFDIMTPPHEFPPDANQFNVPGPAGSGARLVGFRIASDTAATFSRITWRAALEWDVSAGAFLYGSYETGFKSGGFFASNDSQVYQPEYLGAFTLGWKSRLLENRLQANLEVFDWRYRDQQISKISVDSKGATNLMTVNVGRSTIRGFEADLEYLAAVNTRVSADLQYLHASYDSYTFVTPQRPVTGCGVTDQSPGFQVDCSGRRAPFAPRWTLGLEASQVIPLRRRGASLTARSRAQHQTETLAGVDFLPDQVQPGYWVFDASLTLAGAANRLSVGVFGQNLTDRTIISNTFVVPFSTGIVVGTLRPPRTIGVRADWRF